MSRPRDEATLVVRAKHGDAAAYEELVRMHQAIAFRVALVAAGDRGDAEEAVQDGFVKAHRALGRFREGAPFRPWLLAIVSFSLAAGFDGVVTTMLTVAYVLEPPPPHAWLFATMLLGSFTTLTALCLGGVVLLATRRRRFWRLPRRRQWTAALVTFLVVGLFHAAFGGFLAFVMN